MQPWKLAAILDQRSEKGFGQGGLSPQAIEIIAENNFKNITKGNYNKRNKKCDKCYTLKSVTGVCINCD